jgi:DNA-binding CsgD family transcriptional regulator
VLEPSGPRLRFRHGLLRQALYESLPVALRIALNRDAARALIAEGAAAERVAELLLAAADGADGWETDWVVDNAAALAQRAPAAAATLFEQALSHTRQNDPRRPSLEDHLASVCFLLAQYDRAAAVARGILARGANADRRGRAVWILGYVLLRTARPGDALTAVREVAAGLDPGTQWHGRLLAMEAMISQATGRFEEGAAIAEEALALGEHLSDPMAVGYARHTLAMKCYACQDMEGCVAHLVRGIDAIASDPELLDLRLLLQTNQVAALSNLDRFESAREVLGEARQLAERTGTSRQMSFALLTGELAFQTGHWDDALAELAAVSEADPAYAYMPVAAHGIAAVIAAHRDDRALARHHLRMLDETGDVPYRTNNLVYYFRARATVEERAGRLAEAVTLLKEIVVDPAYAAMDDRTTLLPLLVRLALATGDRMLAEEAVAVLDAEAARSPLPRATTARDWSRGLLVGDPEAVLSAAAHYRTSGRRLESAHTLEDAACLLAVGGNATAAREALNDAMLIYTGLGAGWDSRRAVTRLREHGVRLGVRGARGRPRKGWAALTQTELQIAELVALGRSNPDIAADLVLSRRTVETHVSHILAKLELRSRREVADVAASRTH